MKAFRCRFALFAMKRKYPSNQSIAKSHEHLMASFSDSSAKFPCEDASKYCWACGADNPQKAHIVAFSQGGSCEPENFWLLCLWCHKSQPDGASKSVQAQWISGSESQLERHFRLAGPACSAIERLAENQPDGADLLGSFLGRLGDEDELRELVGRARKKGAGSGINQSFANYSFAFVEAFEEFATNVGVR